MQEQIVIKSDNSIQLTAPVMIPGARDCDFLRGEIPFTVEQVKAFKEEYDKYGFIDKHHAVRDANTADKSKLIGDAVNSFLLDNPTSYKWLDGTVHTYPAGTWMLTTDITEPAAIKEAQAGLITGYSPSVFPREQAEQIRAALKASQGGLIKDMSDPVPALVSLVRKPCQHGNKFCRNNNGENMAEDKAQSTLNKIKSILGGDEPQYAMKEDLDELKSEIIGVFKSDEFKDELKGMIDEAVVAATKKPSLKEDDSKKDDDPKPDDKKDEGASGNDDPKPDDKKDDDSKKDDKKPGLKEDSKSLPLHDGDKPALKSDKAVIFEIMGRTKNGRPKKQ